MSLHQRHLTDSVSCDKPGCDEVLLIPDPTWHTWEEKFKKHLVLNKWSMWASNTSRWYCPSHGPSPSSKHSRRIY